MGIIALCVVVQVWGMFVDLRVVQFTAQNRSLMPWELQAEVAKIQAWHPISMWGYVVTEHGPLRMISAAFVHDGWGHLLGNMFFLYTVGCNVEDRWGRPVFAGVYLAGIFASAGAYAWMHPEATVSLIGASGAVSAVMGAFIVFFFFSRILFVWFFWFWTRMGSGDFSWPAWAAIGLWFGLQVLLVWLESQSSCVSVAYSAHVGGFVFGLLVGAGLRITGIDHRLDGAQQARFDAQVAEEVYSVDPRIAEGSGMLRTDPSAALALFAAVAREQPDEGSIRVLVDGLDVHADAADFDRQLGVAMHWARSRRNAKLAVSLVRMGVDKGASMPLDELDWAYLVTAAAELEDAELVVFATGKLLSAYPQSRYLPKALFETAQAQRRAHRPELARTTLERLLAEHPASPFAQRGQELLRELETRA